MRLNCKPRTPDSPLRPDTKSGLRRARPTGARRGGGTRLGQEGCSPRRRAMAAATAGSTGFLLQHSPGAEAHAPTLRAGAGHARPRPRPFTYFLTERPPRLPRPPVGGATGTDPRRLPSSGNGPWRKDLPCEWVFLLTSSLLKALPVSKARE